MSRTDAKKKTTKCIAPGCNRPAHSRGLCHPCYVQSRDAIKSGARTEKELLDLGLLLPLAKRGRKVINPMGRALASLASPKPRKR